MKRLGSKGEQPDATGIKAVIAILLVVITIFPPLGEADPTLDVIEAYDRQFIWDFNNSSDYVLNGAVIENGSLRLLHSDLSYSISTQQDFSNGTFLSIDASTSPGMIMLQKLAPDVFQSFVILNNSNSWDTYIENATPGFSHGSEGILRVGNDARNHSSRTLLSLDPSIFSEIPWDAQLIDVTLSIYQDSSTYPNGISVYSGRSDWSEGSGNWNRTIAMIWINETEAVKRINEPVIAEIPIEGIEIIEPDSQLILYDSLGNEYPSRILEFSMLPGDRVMVRIGFIVSSQPLESQCFLLKLLDDFSPIPSYRIIDPTPTLTWSKNVGDVDCSPVVADLDGDGILEIVTFNSLPQNPEIAAYSLSGTKLWSYQTPSKEDLAIPLVVADINGDGLNEILFACKNTGLKVLESNGNLLSNYSIPGYDGDAIPAIADLDNDGIKEILVSCHATTSSIACLNGNNGSIKWQITLTSIAKAIAIGDFNLSDGLEIALGLWSGRLSIYDSSGSLLGTRVLSNNDFGMTLGVADLNNDSIEDIILGENLPNSKIFGVNGATMEVLFTYTNASNVRFSDGLAIGDLDFDGSVEIVVQERANTASSIVMISSSGAQLWKVPLPDQSYGAVTLADVTGDGIQEILVGDRAAKINILSAKGTYIGAVTVSFNKNTDKVDNSPVVADLDGDAALEMITLSNSNLTVMQLPGFSYDWRMRGRDDTLGSSLRLTNSHDGVRMLEVGISMVALPFMAANWTHATNANPWIRPGGDFNVTNFDSFSATGTGTWQEINIRTIVENWIASGRAQLESIYLVASDESEGFVTFASTENATAIRRPIVRIEYRVARYASTGIFTSTMLGEASTTWWTEISANWTRNEDTDVIFEIRWGNSSTPGDASWSGWLSLSLAEDETPSMISARTRYTQVRATLTTANTAFTPVIDKITVSGLRYISHGYAITNDAILPETIRAWNRSWVSYDSCGGAISLNFSTNSGSNWINIGADGNISFADKSTGRLRLRIDLWNMDYPGTSAWTPVVYSAAASYVLYSTTLTPPTISPRIPHQFVFEDSLPWSIDLSSYINDADDPQSLLRWYVVNESIVAVAGENITGNMMMTLSIPINVNGMDSLTIVVVDSTNMSCSQDLNVTIIPVNDAPIISPIPIITVDPDIPYDFDFTTYISDIETPTNLLNISISGANATYVMINGFIGTFLLPEQLNDTDVQFVLKVDDGNLSAERTFIVRVTALPPQQPPRIFPCIPDQFNDEDALPWVVDLSLHLSDPNEPLSMLRWYVVNETFVHIENENQTGNMNMRLSVPPNINGVDEIALIVVDSTSRSTRQSFLVNIAPVNDPPVLLPISDFTVHFDYPYTINFVPYVSDIDNELSELSLLAVGENATYVSFDGLNATFLLPKALNGTIVRFTISVSDGMAYASTSFNVRVSADFPPRIIIPLPDVTLVQGEFKQNLLNLSDYFTDIDDTTMFFTVGNVHVTITINQKTRMVSFRAPTDWYGVEQVTFRAIDPDNARAEDTINIIVLRGYKSPTIDQIPDLRVRYGTEYKLDLITYVHDPDTPMSELAFTTNISSSYIYFDKGYMKILFPESSSGLTYSVLLTVNDGISTASCIFRIIVGDNYPPGFYPLPDWSFEEDSPQPYPGIGSLSDWFYDYDDEILNYEIRIWDDNVTAQVVISGSYLRIDFRQLPNWFGETMMTIRATDNSSAFAEKTVRLMVLPVNDVPTIRAFGPVQVTAGKEMIIDISEDISDVEDPVDVLLLSTSMPEYAHGLAGKMFFMFPNGFTGLANSTTLQLTIFVRDLDGGMNSTVVTVVVMANTEDTRQAEQIYLWWLIGTLASIGGMMLYIFLTRRIKGPFVIQDVMLIHNNGLLLARYQLGASIKIDDDVFSGMLTAILDFVDESFKREEHGMRKFEFKDYSVLLHRGKNSFLAIAYSGVPPRNIDKLLAGLMTRIENIYGTRIENFSGDSATELAGIEIVLSDFIAENSKISKNEKQPNTKNGRSPK